MHKTSDPLWQKILEREVLPEQPSEEDIEGIKFHLDLVNKEIEDRKKNPK